jgi:hypothetical protein
MIIKIFRIINTTLFLYFIFGPSTFNLFAQEQPVEIEISLLTCSSGEEIYAAFGHSAIRVKDFSNKEDIVFDFGVFDFNEPNFILKFSQGKLKYKLSISDFEDFMYMYRMQDREVVEERLNLTEAEKQEILSMLMHNYLPENRYYYYDFLFDNCSTRIRDLVDTLHAYYVPEDLEGVRTHSFRDNLGQYLHNLTWLKFGIDIVLGSRIDKTMTFREQMFLPVNLSENLRKYRRTDNQAELLAPLLILTQSDSPNFIRRNYFTALNTLIALFILIVLLTWMWPGTIKPIGYFIFILIGLQGLVLLFLWTGTTHYSTKANWNILWVNPLYLLLLFDKFKSLKNLLLIVLLSLDAFILVFWNIIPQEFNIASIPLLGILIYLKARIWYLDYRSRFLTASG